MTGERAGRLVDLGGDGLGRPLQSIAAFRGDAVTWSNFSERAFAAARDLPFDWVTL